ncbi:hypothetical protein PPOP_1645 [Paenibacillus popilliae ATCC 14706]|uniref:Uncharacterized protein n=2 Tax=Paenibacillus popilliae TaxID=78057 RepID=M9M4Q9_PAEPP|nr:hypothetical protein PPOP_1645 [Paenibacillus popilliae ATCC 14706]
MEKETNKKVNELVQGMVNSYLESIKLGHFIEAQDISALAELIDAVGEPKGTSAAIGFKVPTTAGDDE